MFNKFNNLFKFASPGSSNLKNQKTFKKRKNKNQKK